MVVVVVMVGVMVVLMVVRLCDSLLIAAETT